MSKSEVHARIAEIGIIPCIRVSTPEDADYITKEIADAGIPIVEITMIVPGAVDLFAALVRNHPNVIVGAGEVMDLTSARRCLDEGAQFLTGPGLDLGSAPFPANTDALVIPAALTPTEVMKAWSTGCDFVKIFPCAQVGGAHYIHALKAPFPHIPLIASGGVNQETIGDFIRAGATAVGIGEALIPHESIQLRQTHRVRELAHRFATIVKRARAETPHRKEATR